MIAYIFKCFFFYCLSNNLSVSYNHNSYHQHKGGLHSYKLPGQFDAQNGKQNG